MASGLSFRSGRLYRTARRSKMRRDMRVRVRRQILLIIIIATAIRLAFAATTGLGVDESYMVATGRMLSLGYFDHPPTAWWLSWGAAHLFGSEAPIVVRLPFVLLFALTTWLMALLAARSVARAPASSPR